MKFRMESDDSIDKISADGQNMAFMGNNLQNSLLTSFQQKAIQMVFPVFLPQ